MLAKSTNYDWAMAYVRTGCAVLPVLANEKRPACAHGVKDASSDPDQLRVWFPGAPQLNLGIATGPVSGLLVVDVDPKNGGEASYERLTELVGSLGDAPQVSTPSGGRHHYFQFPAARRLRTNLADYPGIDFQGAGRYVVAPPSTFRNRPYSWVTASILEREVPPLPLDLVDLLTEAAVSPGAVSGVSRAIGEGSRNTSLTRIAGALRRQGLGPEEIAAALLEINRRMCQPRLPEYEVRQIAQSVGRYAAGGDYAWADLGNARRLVEMFGADFRYVPAWKLWLVWDGTRWVIDETLAVARLAKAMAEAIVLEAENIEKELYNGK